MIIYQKGGPTPEQKRTDPEFIMWDHFNTPLDAMERARYEAEVPVEGRWQGGYDAQGFWKAGMEVDERGHGGDGPKKPNHPTYSNESWYHNYLYPGGEWSEGYYKPSWLTRAYYKPDRILYHLQDDPVALIYGNDTIRNYYRDEENTNNLKPGPR